MADNIVEFYSTLQHGGSRDYFKVTCHVGSGLETVRLQNKHGDIMYEGTITDPSHRTINIRPINDCNSRDTLENPTIVVSDTDGSIVARCQSEFVFSNYQRFTRLKKVMDKPTFDPRTLQGILKDTLTCIATGRILLPQ
eukprot:gene6579-7523_t